MRRAIITLLVLLSFGLKAQVYQAMPQAGYGPVKRMLFDSVLTIPLNINQLRNITGGRDAGQIRYNVTDSGLYVFSGYQWIKANLDSTNISNRINGKLNISDTAAMLLPYMKFIDTVSLSNRINLRVKYTDTAAMLDPYLRKLDTASLSRRIDEKQNIIKLTTNFKSGAATLIRDTLNIPKYSDTLQDNYVPYVGAIKDVDLGAYKLNANTLTADYLLQAKNSPFSITPTSDYTSITPDKTGFVFYTSWLQGQSTYTQSNRFNYANQAQQNNTREYNLPVRNGTLALVEDTVNLSNRINLKADKATTLTINGVGYDLSANRTWTIPTFDSTSISNRINLKLNISDTASMLSPYLRKADTSSLSNRIDLRVKYSDTAAMLSPYLKSAVTSVGLSMPNAFNVTNSPITSTGTIAVTGAGTAAQYIRGDGQLATLPTTTGGGSSVNYYLNGGVSQGTIGGSTYYEMSKDAITSTTANFDRTNAQGNGLIAQFITDVNDPNRLEIPAGAWNFELYFSASSSGGTPAYYVELLKYDGSAFTLIASNSSTTELITGGTATDLYLSSLAVPYTTLAVTDRLVIRVYVITSGKTITLHTQNGNLCQIVTTFAGGVSSLNGLTANTQYLSVGTAGTDFAISSLTDTHTFNLPTASATNRGALSSTDWSTFNGKMNYSDTVSLSNRINTKLNSSDTASLSNRINAKADALSGTTNTVPKFTSSTTIGNSNIKDNGSAVTINATAGSFGALQVGSYNGNILMNTTNANGGLIFQNTSSSNKLWDFSSDNNDLVFNESNIAPVMKLKAGGNVVISNLSGTGTRMVVADANGVLSSQAISNDTTSLSNRINLKLNISDTASMLSPYLRKVDTSSLSNRINTKQNTITLTTTGTSGAATFSSNTLNIPQYQAAGTYVTSVATNLGLTGGPITTSGTISVDTASASILSRQRAANTYYLASNPNGYTSNTGTVTSVAALTLGTSGTDLSSTVANSTTTPVITLNVPTASATNRGALSSADWTTFNNKVSTATLSGYLPLTGGTLTGALGGTSATFSGQVTAANILVNGNVSSSPLEIANTITSNYYFANSGVGYEAMSRYYNPTAGNWYTGIRASAGIGTTSSYHIFSSTYGGDVFALNTTGAASFSSRVNVNGATDDGSTALNVSSTTGTVSVLNSNRIGGGGISINNNSSPRLYLGNANWMGISGETISSTAISLSTAENSAIIFARNAATSVVETMRITSGGNVGIGTTSPQNIPNYTNLQIEGSTGSVLEMWSNSGGSTRRMQIEASTSAINFYGASSIPMAFWTNSNERMRITSGGNVGVGIVPATNQKFTIKGIDATSSNYNLLLFDNTETTNFYVLNNGAGYLRASAWSYGSDRRIKENIYDVENGLDMVMKMKPKHFDYINGQKDNLGFIAQDIQEIIPEAVNISDEKTGMLALKTDFLVPYLTKAVQELSAQIETLKTKIQTLENK